MEKINPDIEQSQQSHEARDHQTPCLSCDTSPIEAALAMGKPVLVELPWGERRGKEIHERHEIILTRLEGDRLHFFNALKTPGEPGSEIGGPEKGPRRRLEVNGKESMDLALFRGLFQRDGKAMLAN